MKPVRISVVQYLNSAPLAWGILEGPQKTLFEPVLSVPSECAQQLSSGNVLFGLIPSIEYQRIPDTRIVRGPAVVARRAVRSVLLLTRVPLRQVRSVALDLSSRTSAALVRILLEQKHGLNPSYLQARPDVELMLGSADAALIIGDAALQLIHRESVSPTGLTILDLAEEWLDFTGRPFVFAFWAARGGSIEPGLVEALRRSRDEGLERIPEIAAAWSIRLGIPEPLARTYLLENVSYDMDSDCIEGLKLFYLKAGEIGLIGAVRDLDFL